MSVLMDTMQKTPLRQKLLLQRRLLGKDAQTKQKMDAQIGKHLLAWLKTGDKTLVGVYWPIRGEPDLYATFCSMHESGMALALPVMTGKDQPLRFAAWTPGHPMQQDCHGIMMPAAPQRFVCPQVLVIPCVGFNRECFRLGYGGGFYDRTLMQIPRLLTAGVAYGMCEADFLPEPHDMALDVLLTEKGRLPVMKDGRLSGSG